jgi:hypothetical protein
MRGEYVWDEAYRAALVETDDTKLGELIEAARSAIDDRLRELQMDHGGTPDERQAIIDAISGLRVLGRELRRRVQYGSNA